MKKLFVLTLLLLAVGVSAIRAQDVRYNFAQDEDFSKYKTYKWVSINNADQVDELTAKQITSALDAKKGLVWRGVASKTIDPKAKPDKSQKNITKSVAKLLKNYPPEKKT
jgi:hypothetical protein